MGTVQCQLQMPFDPAILILSSYPSHDWRVVSSMHARVFRPYCRGLPGFCLHMKKNSRMRPIMVTGNQNLFVVKAHSQGINMGRLEDELP